MKLAWTNNDVVDEDGNVFNLTGGMAKELVEAGQLEETIDSMGSLLNDRSIPAWRRNILMIDIHNLQAALVKMGIAKAEGKS